MMRAFALVTGYLVMTTIGAVALGALLYLLRDELSARRTRRHYRDRKNRRTTPRATDWPPVIIWHRGPDGEPYVFDVAWAENYTSTEGLLSDLADGGKVLMKTERDK